MISFRRSLILVLRAQAGRKNQTKIIGIISELSENIQMMLKYLTITSASFTVADGRFLLLLLGNSGAIAFRRGRLEKGAGAGVATGCATPRIIASE